MQPLRRTMGPYGSLSCGWWHQSDLLICDKCYLKPCTLYTLGQFLGNGKEKEEDEQCVGSAYVFVVCVCTHVYVRIYVI